MGGWMVDEKDGCNGRFEDYSGGGRVFTNCCGWMMKKIGPIICFELFLNPEL